MLDISNIAKELERHRRSNLYNKYFGQYFHIQKELYRRVQDTDKPITDEELETVLTDLPLELIEVSEALSKFQISQEVVKLRAKEESAKDTSDDIKEYELMSKIYTAVNERVSKKVSFSRELIMSCKKIWDRRKDTDNVTPIGPIDTSLPEYTPPSKQTYVR